MADFADARVAQPGGSARPMWPWIVLAIGLASVVAVALLGRRGRVPAVHPEGV